MQTRCSKSPRPASTWSTRGPVSGRTSWLGLRRLGRKAPLDWAMPASTHAAKNYAKVGAAAIVGSATTPRTEPAVITGRGPCVEETAHSNPCHRCGDRARGERAHRRGARPHGVPGQGRQLHREGVVQHSPTGDLRDAQGDEDAPWLGSSTLCRHAVPRLLERPSSVSRSPRRSPSARPARLPRSAGYGAPTLRANARSESSAG